mgnify:CR=1 FL=1
MYTGIPRPKEDEIMKCARCGKKFGIFEHKETWDNKEISGEYYNKELCMECYWKLREEEAEEYEERSKKVRSCEYCVYFGADYQDIDVGLFTPKFVALESFYCRKFGISLKRPFKEAEKCTSFIREEEYREKVLRGEITKEHEAYFVVCEYCGTRYDANKYPRCPNCSAINR